MSKRREHKSFTSPDALNKKGQGGGKIEIRQNRSFAQPLRRKVSKLSGSGGETEEGIIRRTKEKRITKGPWRKT